MAEQAAEKLKKYAIPNPDRFLNGVRNLLFLGRFCETADPSPANKRGMTKCSFFRGL